MHVFSWVYLFIYISSICMFFSMYVAMCMSFHIHVLQFICLSIYKSSPYTYLFYVYLHFCVYPLYKSFCNVYSICAYISFMCIFFYVYVFYVYVSFMQWFLCVHISYIAAYIYSFLYILF